MRRWGQIAEPKADSWYMDMAKKVYRPDIYALAAKELIEEGKLPASAFPDFATETGFKAPQTEFIDNITFDGTQPNAYLEQFPIGLKGEEVVK
jgi:nitrate/nitrite transport system substrate-binding protein